VAICTGFGWDSIKFLHSYFSGAMFCTCDQNCILAITEQCLLGVKAFSSAHTALPASRLGAHKKFGGNTATKDETK